MGEHGLVAGGPALDVAAIEGGLAAVLAQLHAEEAAVVAEYEARLADVQARREAVETTLRLARGPAAPAGASDATSSDAPVSTPAGISWARRLKGLTQAAALVRIAEIQGGHLRTADATRILFEAGLTNSSRRSIERGVVRLLATSGRFRRVAKGTYQLVPEAAPGEAAARQPSAPEVSANEASGPQP